MNAAGQPFTVLPTNTSQPSQPTAILTQSISSTLAGSQGLTLLSQPGLQYVNLKLFFLPIYETYSTQRLCFTNYTDQSV
jgi:hypothetical protein